MAQGRIDFRADLFERIINEKGYSLTHQKAMLCPCVDAGTRQPNPVCPLCQNGWQYYGDATIKGVISGVTNEKQFVETGGALLGTMTLTVGAGVVLGYHDRITHVDSVVNFSELVVKTNGATDTLRYEALTGLRVVGPGGRVYSSSEYSISGRTLTWLVAVNERPAVGASFSIAYETHPAWLVLNFLHLVRDTTVKFRKPKAVHTQLPTQVLCRLEWLTEG